MRRTKKSFVELHKIHAVIQSWYDSAAADLAIVHGAFVLVVDMESGP